LAEEKLNLYQKLAKVRGIADVAQKSKRGYNYTYIDISEILAKVTAGMSKYGVSLIPSMVPGTQDVAQNIIENVKYTKDGKPLESKTTEMLFQTEMVYTWVNDENPSERIDVPWFAVASMSDVSQSQGSALRYTQRQFLTNYFQIAQVDNDVDAYRSKQKEAEESENRAIAAGITEEVLSVINNYLNVIPEDKRAEEREAIAKIVKKFAKSKGKASGNPKDVTDPAIAAKMLEEIKAKCSIITEAKSK
jgi:hypothetical protein